MLIASKINRAVILFVQNPSTDAWNKRILHGNKTNELLMAFTKKITSSVLEAGQKINFDFFISTNSDYIFNTIYKFSDKKCIRIIQHGNNFGERFESTIDFSFNLGYNQVVILGNDSPEISASHLINAFGELGKNNDAVIGPAEDGGFYLLGLSAFDKKMFNGIVWQTNNVLIHLKINLTTEKKKFFQIETLSDIDNKKDLFIWFSFNTSFSLLIKNLLIFLKPLSAANTRNTPSLIYRLKRLRRINQKAPPAFPISI